MISVGRLVSLSGKDLGATKIAVLPQLTALRSAQNLVNGDTAATGLRGTGRVWRDAGISRLPVRAGRTPRAASGLQRRYLAHPAGVSAGQHPRLASIGAIGRTGCEYVARCSVDLP